jgi:hypothetical protein
MTQRNAVTYQLVYLDTWTLSALGQALTAQRNQFDEFKKAWRETNSVLALSRTHLIELRRHKDSATRSARYDVISELLPGRFDMLLAPEEPVLNAVTDREIAVQLCRLFGREEVLKDADRYWVGFPRRIEGPDDVADVREELEKSSLANVLDLFYEGLKLAAHVSSRDSGQRYERVRLERLSNERLTPEKVEDLVSRVDSELENLPFWHQIRDQFPEDDLAEGLSSAKDYLRRLLNRTQEVGIQKALREGDAHNQSRPNEFFDVHQQNTAFTARIREIAGALTGETNLGMIDNATQGVTRAGCPGLWLRDAVDLELRKSRHHAQASDWMDLDHLTHLPYVDLQFSDYEIAAVTRQVLKRQDTLPKGLLGIHPPIATEASLDAVKHQLTLNARKSP